MIHLHHVKEPSAIDRDRFRNQFAADLRYYLTQQPRQLPSRYLYDEVGSALFEAICQLPWYPITRAERRLLAAHAADVWRHAAPSCLVELGPGGGEKMSLLLELAPVEREAVDVHLVDLSPAALAQGVRAVTAYDGVRATAHEATYEQGLADATDAFPPDGRVLVLFLGSNIGNFDPPGRHAFLLGIRRALRAGDALLLGADLVKPESVLRLAYDDPLGVTAAFNRNLLIRVNRELDADLVIDRFSHRAVWNSDASRVEMHLVAEAPMDIHIAHADLRFSMARGEPIWTESSYKFEPGEICEVLETSGFDTVEQWQDDADRFALTLATAV
jgi:L-histidine Nalpha-methyltransferase